MTLFTKEIVEFMKSNIKGTYLYDLCKMINKKFHTNFTYKQVKNVVGRYHLTNDMNCCFKKGNTPINKGKKWNEYMSEEGQNKSRKTCFKKGNIPINHKAVGSERIDVDGFTLIKIAEPNKWKLKHRVIYEEAYGKIPKGHVCIFLDGDKSNFNIDNLKLISQKENLVMNREQLRYGRKDVTESGVTIAKLIIKIKEKKHGNKKHIN